MKGNGRVIHAAASTGFEFGADAYERGRPGYPVESVQKLVQELNLASDKTVVDLGAGTGKFTRQLREACESKIIAIEPVAGMRKKFSAALPSIEVHDGTAESMPLSDASCDAVVVAQAFHWFDGNRALREIHRVLKPNGYLGLIWNVRDESLPWTAELSNIISPFEKNTPRYKSGEWKIAFDQAALFTEFQFAQFQHVHRGIAQMIVDRIASISFISALPFNKKDQVLEKVRNLLHSSDYTKGKTEIEYPYRTDVFWCRKEN